MLVLVRPGEVAGTLVQIVAAGAARGIGHGCYGRDENWDAAGEHC